MCVPGMVEIGGWNEFIALYAASASNLTMSDPERYACGMPRAGGCVQCRVKLTLLYKENPKRGTLLYKENPKRGTLLLKKKIGGPWRPPLH